MLNFDTTVVCFAAALDTAGLTTAAALTVDTEAS